MDIKQPIFGERSLTKVAAIFENRDAAELAVQRQRADGEPAGIASGR